MRPKSEVVKVVTASSTDGQFCRASRNSSNPALITGQHGSLVGQYVAVVGPSRRR